MMNKLKSSFPLAFNTYFCDKKRKRTKLDKKKRKKRKRNSTKKKPLACFEHTF